ncbi:MAG: hypothetical protein BWY28_03260 [bacterium ADurb.Bin236]|nr:MAG: hypothetical protein BWY28_03260 [bacterium ADurb.Bin236]
MRLRLENGAQVSDVSLDGVEIENVASDDAPAYFPPHGVQRVFERVNEISRIAERR